MRIQVAQARYAGYRGMYLQPPADKDGLWTAIIRFDTAEHFEAWMNSPERAELLSESKVFIEQELEIRFLSPLLTSLGFRAALTTFIVNCLTAAATTFILMPCLVRWFDWWLFVDPKKPAWFESAGFLVVAGLYAIEIASLWHLLPW